MSPRRSVFTLARMCCTSEESLVRKTLGQLPGVQGMTFQVMEKRVTVSHTYESDQVLLDCLERMGMEPSRPGQSLAVGRFEGRFWLSGLLAGGAELAGDGPAALTLSLLSLALGGLPTLQRGWIALRARTINIHFLMSVAVLGALALRQWPEAAMVTFLFGLAEKLEGASLERAQNAIRGLLEESPERAWRVADGQEQEVPAAGVALDETLRVKPGERIALDGVVTGGSSSVNQAPITGESGSVEKGPGDPVFAGTVNELGTFEMRVTATRGHTTLERIVKAVQAAQEQHAPTQRLVDRFAAVYTPAVCLGALLLAVLGPVLTGQPAFSWVYRALALLVVACPCALVLSTPVTVVSGLAAAARQGLLVKGGVFLEEGRRLRVLAFDKTGTLTEGRPMVQEIRALAADSPDEVAQLLASLETPSEHPIACALREHWTGERWPVEEFSALPGWGVRGTVRGRRLQAGSARLLAPEQRQSPPEDERTWIYLLEDGRLLGMAAVADRARPEARAVLAELRALGVRPVMLTGDAPGAARAIASQLGLEEVRAGLLPEDKLACIEELSAQGAVGMVGDGINDAPALARADVGIAMGAAGTAVALETADVALMHDRLERIPTFIRLSRQSARILAQNIAFSLLVKLIFAAVTLFGHGTLWMAILADMGSCLLVIANGLRLLRFQPPGRRCQGCCCDSAA